MSAADAYFAAKWRDNPPETAEGRYILRGAQSLAARYPGLSGPELVRLAYWAASGTQETAS